MSYPKGQTITIVGTFRNEVGELTNPTTVTLRIRFAGATEETVHEWPTPTGTGPISNPSEGVFEREVVLDASGLTYYRWQSTGAVKAATLDEQIAVAESRFA